MQLAKVVIASALVLTTCAEGLPEGKYSSTAIRSYLVLLVSGITVLQSSIVQLELCTGHRGVLRQGTKWKVPMKVPYLTLRCCEGGMEGTDGMGCLVLVGNKEKRER